VGDPVVVGSTYGRVKAMTDDKGRELQTAGPSTPVRLLGLRTVPTAGEELLSVDSEVGRELCDLVCYIQLTK
jgi:translation initiation factor IF-2